MLRTRLGFDESLTFFVTVVIHQRQPIFQDDKIRKLWIECLKYCRKKLGLLLHAYCLLFNHYHLIITPAEGRKIEDVLKHVNGVFANTYNKFTNSSGQIIQRKFWDHLIRNEKDFGEKVNYIHGNPIKHGLVENVEDWPYSSYHNYYCKHPVLLKIDHLDWDAVPLINDDACKQDLQAARAGKKEFDLKVRTLDKLGGKQDLLSTYYL